MTPIGEVRKLLDNRALPRRIRRQGMIRRELSAASTELVAITHLSRRLDVLDVFC
jgi:hypothetical protein